MDGQGCYHFWYHMGLVWPASGNDQIQNTSPRASGITQGGSVGSQRRKQTGRAQRIAEEYEKASRTKRTLKQAQAVLGRLHEEYSGERVVRLSFGQYSSDWLNGKDAETAPSTMDFYPARLAKFSQFLGDRSSNPIAEITKQDVVAFRRSLIAQVSANVRPEIICE